jgi:hypothetical protein
MTALMAAAACDPDAFHGLLEMVMCTAFPEQVMARPAMQAAMARHWDETPPTTPGPDRAQLLRLLAAA